MLKVNQITYEIWDANTNEVLVDNLTFEDAAEWCKTYSDFFGIETMVVEVYSKKIIKHTTAAQQYKNAYTDYMETLFEMGNIL